MFLIDNITPQLEMECSKHDDELSVRRQKEAEDLKRLHKYQRMYKKAVASLIRTEGLPPSEEDLQLLEEILKKNKK